MSTQLPALITPGELQTIGTLAKTFQASGLFSDTKSEAQAVVKILAGRELGLGPFESMRDVNIIQGKTCLSAAQVGARIQQAGGSWEPIQFDEKGCVLRFSKDGKVLKPDISFSFEDARKLGLTQKDNYQKQARTMLFWRALTMGARMLFPGVFGGAVYTPDELRGSVDAEYTVVEPLRASEPVTPSPAEIAVKNTFPEAVTVVPNERQEAKKEAQAIIAGEKPYNGGSLVNHEMAKIAKAERTMSGKPPSDKQIGFLSKLLDKHHIPNDDETMGEVVLALSGYPEVSSKNVSKAIDALANANTPPEQVQHLVRFEEVEPSQDFQDDDIPF